jgi:hypothetical protein
MSLIDIGRGLGEFVNILVHMNKYCTVTSVDVRDWDLWFDAVGRIERIYSNLFDLDFSHGNDIVTCFEVIEHLQPDRIPKTINMLRLLAKKKLFVSVPFMEPFPLSKAHFSRFEAGEMLALFPDARFTVLRKGEIGANVLAVVLYEIDFEN